MNNKREKRYNRIKQWLHIRLAVIMLLRKPLLTLLCLLIMGGITAFVLYAKKAFMAYINVSGILYSGYNCITNFLTILFLILLTLGIFNIIAEWFSKTEEDFWEIFDPKELQHSYYPILMDKKEKATVIFYTFYSWIPYQSWISKKEKIADVFGGFAEIEYAKKHKITLKIMESKKMCEDMFIGIDSLGYPQSKVIEEAFQPLLEQFRTYYFQQYISEENHWIYNFFVGSLLPDIDDDVECLIYLNQLAESVVQRFLHKTKPYIKEMPNMCTITLVGDKLRVFVAKNREGALENAESFERRRLLLRQDTVSKEQPFFDTQLNKELQEMKFEKRGSG